MITSDENLFFPCFGILSFGKVLEKALDHCISLSVYVTTTETSVRFCQDPTAEETSTQ